MRVNDCSQQDRVSPGVGLKLGDSLGRGHGFDSTRLTMDLTGAIRD